MKDPLPLPRVAVERAQRQGAGEQAVQSPGTFWSSQCTLDAQGLPSTCSVPRENEAEDMEQGIDSGERKLWRGGWFSEKDLRGWR